jgi:methionyl-tRNA synthetase
MSKKYYITTAIDYANGAPHLGHAYEKLLADVICRYKRMRGLDVHFVTGLDEFGQKVQQSAQKQNIPPQTFCDGMAVLFQDMCKKLDIQHSDYIRTSQPRHQKVVQHCLQTLFDRGEIYKAEYKGFYSPRQEQFLQEKDRDENGNWPSIFGEVIELTESNYFFKLSQYQNWLIEHIQKNPDFIYPAFRAKQVLEFLKDPLNDLCISRPKERLSWGVPLPFDSNYVTYVWFDALINYITAAHFGEKDFDNYWPADIHIIGKDILCPPHAVYWPIMLKALNIATPKKLLVHGWWTVSGEKMSKSIGNVIDPLAVANDFGADAFRYFMIREMCVGQDSNWTNELFMSRYNSDLANDLGNLLSRLLNMCSRYTENKVPAQLIEEVPETEVKNLWQQTKKEALDEFDTFHFHTGLEKILNFVKSLNRYTEQRAPWKLAKSTSDHDQKLLQTSLAIIAEGLRLAAIALSPVTPTTSQKILNALGYQQPKHFDNELDWSERLKGSGLGEKIILFPKPNIETPTTPNS